MGKYIIRLDDACATMNHDNWEKMEQLLNKYGIKPIVGVIPENKDLDFDWKEDLQFWEKVLKWQSRDWTLALHGLNHLLHKNYDEKLYYQKSHSVQTEFAGVPYEQQEEMIRKGLEIFAAHNIETKCFFAPAHTYDSNTVKACLNSGKISFISDGYALRIYKKDGMIFVPSICDGPFRIKIPGLYTFVFHPSKMSEKGFEALQKFLEKNAEDIVSFDEVIREKEVKQQGILGRIIEYGMYWIRGVRAWLK